MKQNTGTHKSFFAFFWQNLRLQALDFVWIPLVCIGIFCALMLLVGIVAGFEDDFSPFLEGIASIFALIAGMFLNIASAISRFGLEFRLGVKMSIPRRRMLGVGLLLSLLQAAELLAVALLLDLLWGGISNAMWGSYNSFLLAIPLYAWAMLLLAPIAVGAFIAAITQRYGRTAFLVLYFAFLAICFIPMILSDRSDLTSALVALLLPVAPWLGAGLLLVFLVADYLLLRRMPIAE